LSNPETGKNRAGHFWKLEKQKTKNNKQKTKQNKTKQQQKQQNICRNHCHFSQNGRSFPEITVVHYFQKRKILARNGFPFRIPER